MKKIFCILLIFTSCGGHGGGGNSEFILPTPAVNTSIEKVLGNLAFPTSIAFTPDGRMFFTELATGKVRVFGNGNLLEQPFIQLEAPPAGTTDGPVGLAIDPQYSSNRFVYVFHYSSEGGGSNRVTRFKDQASTGTEPLVIANQLPAGGHAGGKLAFGKDHTLFISTGDDGDPASAQDLSSLNGKILRKNRDGSDPQSNPLGNGLYALGFRNVFGLAVQPETGSLYASENGPDCDDEIDKILAAGNYGWREGQPCGDTDPSYLQPIIRIPTTIGLTGITFYQGNVFPEFKNHLFVADYNTGTIRRYVIADRSSSVLEEAIFYAGGSGPILDLAVSPDGILYFCTTEGIYRINRS